MQQVEVHAARFDAEAKEKFALSDQVESACDFRFEQMELDLDVAEKKSGLRPRMPRAR